ncbi:MAG: hypothetical protein A2287_00490 [Candidatus Melainabacteria bacterium RIFOXYA12_FULL_32_12]|nr:MAG: hypothetical protein A2255_03270 [Candidatus Melainabacteria bacterium RIFOXYA2_FULL_32_9]OGI31373.1 MAG: hypothetical protein A2287_00490 [Candidatus Melainabacteria bacterium RIFOXYA12_FULL_32_12]
MPSFINRDNFSSPINTQENSLQEDEKLIQDLKVILTDLTSKNPNTASINKTNTILLNSEKNTRIKYNNRS